jgi:hypothetical protein
MLVLDNENDFLYLYYAVSSPVCDSKINLFFYLYGFNCESEYVFAFSLQALTAAVKEAVFIMEWNPLIK